MFSFGSKVRRRADGTYTLRLEDWERSVLRTLPDQVRDLLSTDDPALVRLYPPAYLADDEKNDEYRRLMRDDLTAKRLGSLEVLEATIDATRLDEEQLLAWMGAINDVRLVLGTRLDVSEDPSEDEVSDDDPRAPGYQLYAYLGMLLDTIVSALSGSL